MGILLHLHEVKMGFSNIVNKYSADDKPKGKTELKIYNYTITKIPGEG